MPTCCSNERGPFPTLDGRTDVPSSNEDDRFPSLDVHRNAIPPRHDYEARRSRRGSELASRPSAQARTAPVPFPPRIPLPLARTAPHRRERVLRPTRSCVQPRIPSVTRERVPKGQDREETPEREGSQKAKAEKKLPSGRGGKGPDRPRQRRNSQKGREGSTTVPASKRIRGGAASERSVSIRIERKKDERRGEETHARCCTQGRGRIGTVRGGNDAAGTRGDRRRKLELERTDRLQLAQETRRANSSRNERLTRDRYVPSTAKAGTGKSPPKSRPRARNGRADSPIERRVHSGGWRRCSNAPRAI